jgi:hypothetical protein
MTTTLSTVSRAGLTAALLALAGILGWIGVTRSTGGGGGVALLLLLVAVLPLAAAGLLYVRRGVGSALAILAAVVGALVGVGLSFCLCAAPLKPESIALLIGSLAVLIFALADLQARGLGLLAIVIAAVIFVFTFSSNLPILAAGLVVAAAVAWVLLRRRRPAGGAPAA